MRKRDLGEQALGAELNGQTFNKLTKLRHRCEAAKRSHLSCFRKNGGFGVWRPERWLWLVSEAARLSQIPAKSRQQSCRFSQNIRLTRLPVASLGRKLSSNQARKQVLDDIRWWAELGVSGKSWLEEHLESNYNVGAASSLHLSMRTLNTTIQKHSANSYEPPTGKMTCLAYVFS